MHDSPPSANPHRWWVLAAVGAGTFMSALDSSVVNVVLPVIRRTFGATPATIQWVVTVYLLVVSGFLLTFGRFGDLVGHRRVYLWGFLGFVAGSIACGIAPSAGVLISARAAQAMGAAMLFATGPAIITTTFPATERGRALGLSATMTYIGLTLGPPLGGWLADALSWRAVFYINVPIGLGALALAARVVPVEEPGAAKERFDVAGAATFISGLVALMIALNQGHAWGWGSPLTLGLTGVALVLLAAFVAIERRSAFPMLDLGLFSRPAFSGSTVSALLNYVAIYGVIFLMPFWAIEGRGLSPSRAGLLLTVQAIVMAVVAPISGALSDRIGTRLPAVAGMGVLATGLVMLSRLGPTTHLAYAGLSLAVAGLGTGVFISPNNSALMGAAPRHRQGIAAAVLAEARNVGMVLGVGLAGAIFTSFAHETPAGAPPQPGLFAGVSWAFLAAAAVAALAAVTSAARPAEGSGVESPGIG